MKKLLALLLVLVMVVALVACGGNGNETEAPTNNSQPASDATEDTGNSDTPVGTDLKVAVFYYTYSDTYISSVRTALDAQLDALDVTYQDFDSNGNQTTQNEAIQTAIADGYNLLIVNMVTSGSPDVANEIISMANGTPVIFFNRAIEADGNEGTVLNANATISFIGTDAPEAGHLQGKMSANICWPTGTPLISTATARSATRCSRATRPTLRPSTAPSSVLRMPTRF